MAWTYADAEAYIASLEPFGWRFGLDRIQRLLAVLGMPQRRFASIHVVGTNGKSSTALMAAALLEAHGMSAGAYVSPHTERWTERIVIRDEEISESAFAAALERVAASVPAVERSLDEGDAITQFEVTTAAAFVALADAGVEAGVVEAGLGGRLDATNVLPSRVVALTSIGLEHTQWLGETEEEIAAEKLAVLRDHAALVLGAVSPAVRALAERTASERGARLVDASVPVEAPGLAPYLRRNLAVAAAAATELAGPLDPQRVAAVAGGLELPGRAEALKGDPPLVLDAAHNPDGARAVVEALRDQAARRPVVACIAVLDDKDASAMLSTLAERVDTLVCTELPPERLAGMGRPGARTIASQELARLAVKAGVPQVEAIGDAAEAVQRARSLAKENGGVALITGSHYLLRYAEEAAAQG